MACRTFEITLDCGCMLSSDGGGGLIPCHYGYGCGKKNCREGHECKKCIEQYDLCDKAWIKFMKVKRRERNENKRYA